MNPIRALRILTRAKRLFDLIERATASYTREGTMSKSLFASKLFWVNVLTAAADLAGVLPIPPGVITPTLAVINVVLRIITTQPVHILPPTK